MRNKHFDVYIIYFHAPSHKLMLSLTGHLENSWLSFFKICLRINLIPSSIGSIPRIVIFLVFDYVLRETLKYVNYYSTYYTKLRYACHQTVGGSGWRKRSPRSNPRVPQLAAPLPLKTTQESESSLHADDKHQLDSFMKIFSFLFFLWELIHSKYLHRWDRNPLRNRDTVKPAFVGRLAEMTRRGSMLVAHAMMGFGKDPKP